MLSEIDFASFNSCHEILLHGVDFTEAEKQLTDERKRYLRTAAKEKAGQASGAGALSSVARSIYNRMVKQAVRTVGLIPSFCRPAADTSSSTRQDAVFHTACFAVFNHLHRLLSNFGRRSRGTLRLRTTTTTP